MSKNAPVPWWLILLLGSCALVFGIIETLAIVDGTDGTDLTRSALQIYQSLRAVCLTAFVCGLLIWGIQQTQRAVTRARAEGYTGGLSKSSSVRSVPTRRGPWLPAEDSGPIP